jgi:hypothetical protein
MHCPHCGGDQFISGRLGAFGVMATEPFGVKIEFYVPEVKKSIWDLTYPEAPMQGDVEVCANCGAMRGKVKTGRLGSLVRRQAPGATAGAADKTGSRW